MMSGLPPCTATCSARNRISTPFVLHIPVTTIVGASLMGTSWDGPLWATCQTVAPCPCP